MKNLRISLVTDHFFNKEYYIVEEKKKFFKIFSYWKACKYFFYGMSVDEEDGAFIPYTFESVEKAKEFIKEKYQNFCLMNKIYHRTEQGPLDEI